ncbi:MAG TPA: AAA family ATPase [Acidimicrobiales bacterium]|nr:AAA family ATPase [Acidimicrobiales bacterium]
MVSSGRRVVVLVSGPPGSGKSTVAVPLAGALGFPLVAKDYVKEAIWDAVGPPVGDLTWSRRTGAAVMEVLWAVAARCDRVVLEANFRPRSHYERGKLAGLDACVVEVYCSCAAEIAACRYAARASSDAHHAAHVGRTVTPEALAEFDRPVALGPVIRVDTTAPVDIHTLASDVFALIRGPEARTV